MLALNNNNVDSVIVFLFYYTIVYSLEFSLNLSRVGYRLNFIDFDSDSDSAYRFRLFSIPM